MLLSKPLRPSFSPAAGSVVFFPSQFLVFLERTPDAGDTYKITTKILLGLFGLAALFTLVEVIIKPKTPDPLKEKS